MPVRVFRVTLIGSSAALIEARVVLVIAARIGSNADTFRETRVINMSDKHLSIPAHDRETRQFQLSRRESADIFRSRFFREMNGFGQRKQDRGCFTQVT